MLYVWHKFGMPCGVDLAPNGHDLLHARAQCMCLLTCVRTGPTHPITAWPSMQTNNTLQVSMWFPYQSMAIIASVDQGTTLHPAPPPPRAYITTNEKGAP